MLVTHHAQQNEEAGDHRGSEQRRRRKSEHEPDDDVGDRRWNEDTGARARGDQRAGVRLGVAAVDQAGHRDAADGGGIGCIGARDAGEKPAAKRCGGPEAGAHPARGRFGEIKQLVRESGAHHDVAGKYEQRDRDQRKRVDALEQRFAEQRQRQRTGAKQERDRAESDRNPERHGQRQQCDDEEQAERERHEP